MHNLNRAADRRQYNFLQNYIHRRLKHSRIQRFGEDIEDASATNNIWNTTKLFTKLQTRHTPVIHGRSGLTYTPLDKATAIAEVSIKP
jgi:hypothetical protein